MLRIQNHLLEGDGVTQRPTPTIRGPLNPRFLVMHYTAGASAESSVSWLCNPAAKASAHIVLGRDGRIWQLAPFNRVTLHAGISHWAGLTGLNGYSIGIEMDNAGPLKRVGNKFMTSFGRETKADEVLLAAHRHGGGEQPWHAYTAVQIERAFELAELLVAQYGLEEVLGHEDVARGRKSDPGPAFPLSSLAARLAGRQEDDFPRLRVTSATLNIRSGPDASHPTVAPALRKGTELALLEAGERWNRVAVLGRTDIEGWVANAFLERVVSAPAAPAAPRRAGRVGRAAPDSATAAPAPAPAPAPRATRRTARAAPAAPTAAPAPAPANGTRARRSAG
jgi:N-acetylmuramoyl-L-alanine amidase